MKILAITEFYPIHPRLIKISESLKRKKDVFYFSYCYETKAKIKVLKEIKYFFITFQNLREIRPEIIVCRGLKPLVFCSILNVFYKGKIFYDIPDMIPLKSKYRFYLEQKCIKRVERIILASRFFYKFYKKHSDKIVILENYPSKKLYKLDLKTKFKFNSSFKILSFIGFIRYFDILKNLVDSVKNKKINLLFFGKGKDEEKLKKYCFENKITNVFFFGKYDYKDLYKFYNISDFIWAAYDYRIENVKYAISNKFYEDILYEKIGIYSKFTELGNYIEKNNIGLTIDCFNKEELEGLINSLINNEYKEIKENIKKYKNTKKIFWEEQIEELNKLREEK